MSGGGGSQNTTTTSNAPPQEYLDAYKKITSQASGVAAAPYSPYPGQKLADFSPDQQAGIQGVRNAQGVSDPYINAGAQYIDRATQPIWDNSMHPDQGMMQNLPGQAMGNLNYAQTGAIDAAGRSLTPGSISQFESPHTNDVVAATQRDFQNQNDIQQQGIIGDAIGKGAWGGDRSAVAQGIIAGQQARAQDPVIAGLREKGWTDAADLAKASTGYQLQGATGQAGALSDVAKQQLGFYGGQQGAELGAKQAEGWLNMQGAGGMGSLGNQALNSSLTGANALLGVGGMEQGQAQAGLNIPYQEWQASQAYPFQTTGWLSNIVQGLGGASGGTGSTTTPGPSTASQIGGLATAGVGALGSSGAFGKEGWLTGSGGWGSNAVSPSTVASNQAYQAGAFASQPAGTYGPFQARGGRIERAVGGGIVPGYAFGGPTSGIGPLDEMSVVPGADGINVPSASSGRSNILGNYGQTQTTSGGGSKDSEIGSLVKTAGLAAATIWGGPAGAAAGSAFNSAVHFDRGGGIVDNETMYRGVPRLADGGNPNVTIMQSSHGGPGIPQLTGGGGGAGIAPSGSVNDYLASQAKGQVGLPKPPVAATDGPAKGVPDVPQDDPAHNIFHVPGQSAFMMDPAYVQQGPGGSIYNREGMLVRGSELPGYEHLSARLPGFDSMGGGGGGMARGGIIGREEGGDVPQEAPQAPSEPEQNVDIKIPDVGDPTPSVNSTLGLPEDYRGGPTLPRGAGIVASPQGGSASPVHQGPHGPVPMQAGPGYVPPPPELAPVVEQAAAKYGVDPKQLAWLLSTESRWNPKAYNRLSGTIGIGQFKPGTAQEMQIDPWDPHQAIMGAAGYLRKMLDKNGGDYERAIGRYGTFSTGQGKEADEAVRQRYRAFMGQTQSAARGGGIVGLAGGGTAPTEANGGIGPVSLGPLALGPEQNPLLIPGATQGPGNLDIRTDDDPQAPSPPADAPMPGVDPSGLLVYGANATKDPFVPELEKPRSTAQTIRDVAANPPSSGGEGSGDTGAGIVPPPPPAPPGAPNAGSPDADKDKEDNPKVSGWQKLMNVGLGIMAGTSPHALVNVGAGALKGIALSDKEQQTLEAAATRRDVAKTNAVWRNAQGRNLNAKTDVIPQQEARKDADLARKVAKDQVMAEFTTWKMAHGDATLEEQRRKLNETITQHGASNVLRGLSIDMRGHIADQADETRRDIAGQTDQTKRDISGQVSEDRRRGQDLRAGAAAASREIQQNKAISLNDYRDRMMDWRDRQFDALVKQRGIQNDRNAQHDLRTELNDAVNQQLRAISAGKDPLGVRPAPTASEAGATVRKLRSQAPSLSSPSKQAVTPPVVKPRIKYDESGNPLPPGS